VKTSHERAEHWCIGGVVTKLDIREYDQDKHQL